MFITEYGALFMALALMVGIYLAGENGVRGIPHTLGLSLRFDAGFGLGFGSAITFKKILILAVIFEFLGAFLAGGHVITTIRKRIIEPTPIIDNPEIFVLGMVSALFAAGVWLILATIIGWPVSTTQSIVGAIVGFGMVGIGVEAVQWKTLGMIGMSWLIAPLFGGLFAFFLMKNTQKIILDTATPFKNAQRSVLWYLFLAGFLIALLVLFQGVDYLNLELTIFKSVLVAGLTGIVIASLGRVFIAKITREAEEGLASEYAGVERIFGVMLTFAACAMAFAHGSNDLANGIGPMAVVISIVREGAGVLQKSALPLWMIAVGGGSLAIGMATMAYRVIRTLRPEVIELAPTRRFSVLLAAAVTVVFASRIGMPVSTTQVALGAVVGVSLARGIGALNLQAIGKICISWFLTMPAAGSLSALFYLFFKAIFLSHQ